jgi:hypothetical protein
MTAVASNVAVGLTTRLEAGHGVRPQPPSWLMTPVTWIRQGAHMGKPKLRPTRDLGDLGQSGTSRVSSQSGCADSQLSIREHVMTQGSEGVVHAPAIGQVWEDRCSRERGRLLRICAIDGSDVVVVTVQDHEGRMDRLGFWAVPPPVRSSVGRHTRIRVDRLTASRGYRLLRAVPES